jgi:steroid delta-isomerase-like uncharacterized protein
MSEENKAIARRYLEEAFNNRNLDVIDEIVSDDYIDHHIRFELPRGPEGVKLFFNYLFSAFPDCRFIAKDVISEGDKVVTRFEFTGTHQGEFVGIPGTGKQFSITGIDIVRITDGKLMERWENADGLGWMRQLGVIPSPGE